MQRILIGLFVPAVNKHYDVFVPTGLDLRSLSDLLSNGVAELSDGRYSPSRLEMLTLKEPETLLRPDRCLDDYNIEDGAELILI